MGDGLSLWSDPFGKKRPNFLFNKMQSRPEKHLPEITNSNLKEFQDRQKNIKFIWLGHSTILLSINGKVVLIDPVFSKPASPVSFLVKRFQSPAIPLAKLPVIDYILISHDHYDHLDMETIKHFVEQDVRFVVPLGVGSHLQHWGIDPHKIIELDWWQTEKTGSLVFTAIPAQHYSGRLGPISPMKTLWASWVIKSPTRSVYFSGDSGYHSHYREIGQKHGPFDIVFMDSGQYNAR